MIEKKLILCGILAIAIGIATIVPLEYMMAAENQVNAQTTFTPWFNVSVPYAYVNLDQSGGNSTMTWDAASIEAIANFSLTPDAIALKNADARIEFYQFQVSSDQGPIVNITYSVAVSIEKLNVTGVPGGVYMAITGSGGNSFTFADGTTYKGPSTGNCGGDVVLANIPGEPMQNFTNAVVSTFVASYNGNSASQLTELRNAKTLYIDLSRICSVSFEGNAITGTTTTVSSDKVLQHIVLTKEGNGFVYGTYTAGTVPFPIETPSNPTGSSSLNPNILEPYNSTLANP
ncbi:MAG: hypothetical protein ABSG33_00225 [Candidatus Bathyarchaeia archaeon]|jgi:hypothetical protein